MATILTLAEYKIAKDITVATYDAQLTLIIDMINEFIISYCNREFGVDTYTEQKEGVMNNLSQYVFQVDQPPITSVTSVEITFKGVPSTPLSVDITRLDLFSKAGYAYYSYVLNPSVSVIRPEYRYDFYYTIVYIGGTAVPGPVKLAAIMMVSDTFEYFTRTDSIKTGTKTDDLKSIKIGDYQETYKEGHNTLFASMHNTKTGVVVSQTVRDLLAPYLNEGQSW